MRAKSCVEKNEISLEDEDGLFISRFAPELERVEGVWRMSLWQRT